MPVTLCSTNNEVRSRAGVVVTATHPVLGAVYWEFVSEASVGGPDYFSLSTNMTRALLLEPGWRETAALSYHGNHVKRVIREQVVEGVLHDEEHGDFTHVEFEGGLAELFGKSGQTAEEFLSWLRTANWHDTPGPVRIEHLIDHGFSQSWEMQSQIIPSADHAEVVAGGSGTAASA